MKIALISTRSTSGKTFFTMTAASVYARVMSKPVYLCTTGSFSDHFAMAADIDVKMVGHTPECQAAIRSDSITSAESFATSFTKDGVYPICEFSDPATADVKANTMRGIGSLVKDSSSMVIVEIDNYAEQKLNTEIIKQCDVALIFVSPELNCAAKIQEIKSRYDISIPSFVVFSMYNPLSVSTKDLQTYLSDKFFTYSYNATALKYVNRRALDRLVEDITKGGNGLGTIRTEIYNIFSAVYKPVKLPEVSRW